MEKNALDGVRLPHPHPRDWLPSWQPGLILAFLLEPGFSAAAPLALGPDTPLLRRVLSCAL